MFTEEARTTKDGDEFDELRHDSRWPHYSICSQHQLDAATSALPEAH